MGRMNVYGRIQEGECMVPKFLQEFAEKILADVLRPVLQWLEQLSWRGKAALVLALVTGAIAYHQRAWLSDVAELANYQRRKMPAGAKPDLSAAASQALEQAIGFLRPALEAALPRSSKNIASLRSTDVRYDTWTISQIAVALAPYGTLDGQFVAELLRAPSQVDTDCSCWHQIPKRGAPNVAVSAWILYAMGTMQIAATQQELDFLLNSQFDNSVNQRGGWPVFAGAKPEYASTYATARAVLAIREQLRRGLVTDEGFRRRLQDSMRRGLGWLIANPAPGSRSRWRLYPTIEGSIVSDGASGVVMQAFHSVHDNDLAKVNEAWVRVLPKTVQDNDIEATGNFDRWIYFTDPAVPQEPDVIRHQRLAWLLVGTVETYYDISGWNKARALRWIERAVFQINDLVSTLPAEPWTRAEVLIALNRVKGHYAAD